MSKIMNPSTVEQDQISSEQINKLGDLMIAGLRKAGLARKPTQVVIETQGKPLVAELVATVRRYVEMVSNTITRCVPVNRSRTSMAALKATGRRLYVDDTVVANMPKGEGRQTKTVFFRLDRSLWNSYVSCDVIDKKYEMLGLVPETPYSLAAVNEADPEFADRYPNVTYWNGVDGKLCFAAFRKLHGERAVDIGHNETSWLGSFWYAGRPK